MTCAAPPSLSRAATDITRGTRETGGSLGMAAQRLQGSTEDPRHTETYKLPEKEFKMWSEGSLVRLKRIK
jgi:hypothetical protein